MDPKTYKELVERNDLSAEEKLELIFADLPPETEAEAAERRALDDEEYYLETAENSLVGFSILLQDWTKATRDTFGESSVETKNVNQQVAAIDEKLEEYRRNVTSDEARRAVQAVKQIMGEYRGWYQGDDGKIQFRDRRADPEVVSTFWRGVRHSLS